MLGAVAACCNQDVGLEFDGGLQIGDSVADVKVVRTPKRSATQAPGGGFMERVQDALQAAVHPDSSPGGSGGGNVVNLDGGGSYASTAQVVPFPVVSPYRPLTATRVPIEGLTAFPKRGYYFNGDNGADFNVGGDDSSERLPPGHENLGFVDPAMSAPQGVGLESDSYSSLGMQWEGVIGQIVQGTPAIIGSVRGQPYYDPNQSSNPQLFPQYNERPGGAYPVGASGAGANIGSQAGAAVGNIGDTISNIVTQNPLLVLGGGVLLLFLFMKPPGRR